MKEEIIEMQRRHRRLKERSKTIVADLRSIPSPLMHEAAEIIEWLLGQVTALKQAINEEIKDGKRQARDAYAQGQQDEYDKNRLA